MCKTYLYRVYYLLISRIPLYSLLGILNFSRIFQQLWFYKSSKYSFVVKSLLAKSINQIGWLEVLSSLGCQIKLITQHIIIMLKTLLRTSNKHSELEL